jgi:serine/threonine protein kinase
MHELFVPRPRLAYVDLMLAICLQPFMFQLLRGQAFMHQHGIMHRDLKPQNLLVDPDRKMLKIADLGLGRVFSMPVKAYTHEASAAQLQLHSYSSQASDMYA